MPGLIIETNGLTRRFGKHLAVDELNLNVPEAGIYGFLGPNGAGKTTTIRMLLGLIKPNAGDVRLFGEPLVSNRLSLMRRVGALVETPSLYPHLTGRENLEVTRRLLGVSRGLIDRSLDIVRLTKDAHRRVREYSLGMRQRLGLALALLNNPKLLVLDEPANGLDPAGIHEMRELIRNLATESGITVFLSSHLLSEVEQIASHIGIIHHGRLLFEGTLLELQAQRREHLSLGVKQPDKAILALGRAGWTAEKRDDGLLTVATTASESVAAINALLVREQIDVYHLAVAQASLEDIFLSLTGAGADARRAA